MERLLVIRTLLLVSDGTGRPLAHVGHSSGLTVIQ